MGGVACCCAVVPQAVLEQQNDARRFNELHFSLLFHPPVPHVTVLTSSTLQFCYTCYTKLRLIQELCEEANVTLGEERC